MIYPLILAVKILYHQRLLELTSGKNISDYSFPPKSYAMFSNLKTYLLLVVGSLIIFVLRQLSQVSNLESFPVRIAISIFASGIILSLFIVLFREGSLLLKAYKFYRQNA